MSKQDRQGVRKASELEQKYDLGLISKTKQNDNAQVNKLTQELSQFKVSTNNELENLKNMIEDSALPIASADTLGGVKIGANINVAEDGTISVSTSQGGNNEYDGDTVFESETFGATRVKRVGSSNGASIGFENADGVLGYVGMLSSEGNTLVKWSADTQDHCNVLDEDNFSKYALPLTGANKVLWSGAIFMNGNQTATLSEAVSAQPNGIVLVFSRYNDGSALNDHWATLFIPKLHVRAWGAVNMCCQMATYNYYYVSSKYLVVKDTQIIGNAYNSSNGTWSGVTWDNTYYVMRYVYGV